MRLGIDLIEIKRAKAFYNKHKNRLTSVLNMDEARFIKKGPKPYENCAMILAGKEAAYKALGGLKSNLANFQDVNLTVRQNKFLVKTKSKKKLEIDFIKTNHFIIASCS